MTVIGFTFSKISAERKSSPKGQVKINRNCVPTAVEEISIGGGQKALRYSFEFTAKYDPEVAELEFHGHLVELVKPEEHTAVLETWEKSQAFPPASLERIMNNILDRCHTEAILMAKELGIPSPIQLPSVRVQQKQEE